MGGDPQAGTRGRDYTRRGREDGAARVGAHGRGSTGGDVWTGRALVPVDWAVPVERGGVVLRCLYFAAWGSVRNGRVAEVEVRGRGQAGAGGGADWEEGRGGQAVCVCEWVGGGSAPTLNNVYRHHCAAACRLHCGRPPKAHIPPQCH